MDCIQDQHQPVYVVLESLDEGWAHVVEFYLDTVQLLANKIFESQYLLEWVVTVLVDDKGHKKGVAKGSGS